MFIFCNVKKYIFFPCSRTSQLKLLAGVVVKRPEKQKEGK